ncbi:MAG: hypothetical protein V1720_08265 [bacterium]
MAKKILTYLCLVACVEFGFAGSILAKTYFGLPQDSAVAKVGSRIITTEEFVNSYEYGPAFYKRSEDSKKVFLDDLIREKLLAQDACSRGLDTTIDVRNTLQAFMDDIATEEMFKKEILSQVTYTPEEVDTVAKQKLIDVEVRWLYSNSKEEISRLNDSLKAGISFEKLFNRQINDTVYTEDRLLNTTRYLLGMKNPLLGKIIDTMKVGSYSLPISVDNGWYIIELKNFSYRLISSETEQNKITEEAQQAVIKTKSDLLSDKYVHGLMLSNNPVIKRKPFQILRSYLAGSELPDEKYKEWLFDEKLLSALKDYEGIKENDYPGIVIVELTDSKITLGEYLNWFRLRSQYIKLDKRSFAQYSRSLEQTIWQMVRDHLLAKSARSKGYYENWNVKKQAQFWLDKILYATVKNETINSILIENKEIASLPDTSRTQAELIENELTKKYFYKLNNLKKQFEVKINEQVLNSIQVSEENNPDAIEFYTVKNRGLIPRTPFPTIDNYWARWK